MLDANGQLALDANGKIIQDGNITPIGAPFQRPGADLRPELRRQHDLLGEPGSGGHQPKQRPAALAERQQPERPDPSLHPDDRRQPGQRRGELEVVLGRLGRGPGQLAHEPGQRGPDPAEPPVDPNFQWHHQPLAYYDNFAPWIKDPNTGQMVQNPLSAAHLQDETNFFTDLSGGNLPAVSFIKPVGENNEHPGYADLLTGQQHVADIVHAVQNSPDWAHTAIIITYDENGGRWDHVAPPNSNGGWGDGTRVPAIVISPLAKKGYVDHTEHDTLSILKTIEERFAPPAAQRPGREREQP